MGNREGKNWGGGSNMTTLKAFRKEIIQEGSPRCGRRFSRCGSCPLQVSGAVTRLTVYRAARHTSEHQARRMPESYTYGKSSFCKNCSLGVWKQHEIEKSAPTRRNCRDLWPDICDGRPIAFKKLWFIYFVNFYLAALPTRKQRLGKPGAIKKTQKFFVH